jgi:predicted extracellular nuclease
MNKIATVLAIFIGTTLSLCATPSDLYISEYIEGGSNNKALELYNPLDTAINLSDYSLELYNNGATTPNTTLTLSGTVSSKDVFVLANSSAVATVQAQADINSSITNYNGDDALVLKKNGVIIDSIGRVGEDPGTAWSLNGVSTLNSTLVRIDASAPDVDTSDLYDPSTQWTSFAQDTFTFLGAHGSSENNDTTDNNTTIQTTLIHAIQGGGTQSPIIGQTVTIEAVVTADYTQGGFNGFYVQEEELDYDTNLTTSEGIFIYSPSVSVTLKEGDVVKVTGAIQEFSNLTEIVASKVEVVSSGAVLPAPLDLQLPVSSLLDMESVEGMLVHVGAGDKPLVVNDVFTLGRFGNFSVSSENLVQFTQTTTPSVEGYAAHQEALLLKSLVVDDGSSSQNPAVIKYPAEGLTFDNTLRGGYTIDELVGVMDQRFGSYVIQPQVNTTLTFNAESNPRESVKAKERRDIRVASFNVLNYFNTFENCTYGVGGAAADCRGADNAQEFERQKTKIINAMLELNADIMGLMEIENDGYGSDSAIADLVNTLNATIGRNKSVEYAYVNVDAKLQRVNALGTDAIKVALIYNKKRVRALGNPHAVVLDQDEIGRSRPSLIQVFGSVRTFGRIAVSVNHLKSKGSACNDASYEGVQDIDQKDGQGNCNLTRSYAANVLTEYISTNRQLRRYRNNTILMGDFNSYANEDPVKIIENKGYTNLLANASGAEEYTYRFRMGEAGTLDYIFASNRLQRKISSVAVWHSNSDEPIALDYNLEFKTPSQYETLYGDGPYRASDHDQVVVDIRL